LLESLLQLKHELKRDVYQRFPGRVSYMGREIDLKWLVQSIFGLFLVGVFLAKGAFAEAPNHRVSAIFFFGYGGLDLDKIKPSLPVHVGDNWSSESIARLSKSIETLTGHKPTDIAAITYKNDNLVLYIGLPGSSSHSLSYNAEPTGDSHLPQAVEGLYKQAVEATSEALRKGGVSADASNGYGISSDPKLRTSELAMRDFAVTHKELIFQVLGTSADPQQRALAAHALGYGERSKRQSAALIAATRDANANVRNNATRALSILALTDPTIEQQIPIEQLCEMLNSGSWTDRNKATSLLESTGLLETSLKNNDSALISILRTHCLDSLCEMACWDTADNAELYRSILARIAGIPDTQRQKLPVSELLSAAKRCRTAKDKNSGNP
jgi:hypothetical protein